MKKRRGTLPAIQREQASKVICDKLWSLIQERNVQVLHSFLPMGSEINILPLLEKALSADITVVAPETLPKRQLKHLVLTNINAIESGLFDTRFPTGGIEYKGPIDLILVPGLAFTASGQRLGYGGGYYDRFLSQHPNSYKVGIAFEFQLIDHLPVEPHDIRLDYIISS